MPTIQAIVINPFNKTVYTEGYEGKSAHLLLEAKEFEVGNKKIRLNKEDNQHLLYFHEKAQKVFGYSFTSLGDTIYYGMGLILANYKKGIKTIVFSDAEYTEEEILSSIVWHPEATEIDQLIYELKTKCGSTVSELTVREYANYLPIEQIRKCLQGECNQIINCLQNALEKSRNSYDANNPYDASKV